MNTFSLSGLALTTAFASFGQLGTAPQIGETFEFRTLDITLSDTGAIGNNSIWDFSAANVGMLDSYFLTYRLPSSEELMSDPSIDFVEETLNGETYMYRMNADSIFMVGLYEPVESAYIPFTDLNTVFLLPESANLTPQSDDFNLSYDFGVPIEIIGHDQWSISGQGTVITPFGTYANAKKVSRYTQYEFYMFDMHLTTATTTRIQFFDAVLSKPIVTVEYNDDEGEFTAYVLQEQTSAGVTEQDIDPILFHPNPASEQVTLHPSVHHYAICTLDGKQVTSGSDTSSINVEMLMPGTYLVKLSTEHSEYTQKLIIR